MVQVTYNYYRNTYQGTAISTEADFNAIEQKATLFLDSVAPADIMALDEEKMSVTLLLKYQMCICNMCDALYNMYEDGLLKGAVKSEKVGAWTTTYAIKEGTTASNTLSGIINMYLSGTELMCAWC
jgi:hypothetical protein